MRSCTHILILGSTGSIGRQALEVLPSLPHARLVGLAAHRSTSAVIAQALAAEVSTLCLSDEAAAREATAAAPALTVFAGELGLAEMIERAAETAAAEGASLTVLNGIVGAAGLRATLTTLENGATLALANKESLVAGGPFVLAAARRSGAAILPVDSEHSALFQCLAADGEPGVAGAALEELLLTGSGGPFRTRPAASLARVIPEEALAHPTWSMGPKISVDSATLMNKGLEVIEAHYLFNVPYERIRVLIGPQSVVHSMVRFADGAIIAHLGAPDMRTPIGYALAYPHRPTLPMVPRFNFAGAELTFAEPNTATFRCLALAQEAGKRAAAVEERAALRGLVRTAAAPIALNAANEVAVDAFLQRRLGFLGIPEVVERCLALHGDEAVSSVDDVIAYDAATRRSARELVAGGLS